MLSTTTSNVNMTLEIAAFNAPSDRMALGHHSSPMFPHRLRARMKYDENTSEVFHRARLSIGVALGSLSSIMGLGTLGYKLLGDPATAGSTRST